MHQICQKLLYSCTVTLYSEMDVHIFLYDVMFGSNQKYYRIKGSSFSFGRHVQV